jgi:hypothetical protein
MQISLSPEHFRILRDLIDRGMEEKLAPFDDLEVVGETEQMIVDTLDAVAFFNSHAITHHIE